jgi:hypothetical protein
MRSARSKGIRQRVLNRSAVDVLDDKNRTIVLIDVLPRQPPKIIVATETSILAV